MAYNSFFFNILLRLILLLANLTGMAYLIVLRDRFFTILVLILLAILQTLLLFIFLNRTNRNLASFLLLLTQEDTSVSIWKDRVEKTFKGLHHSFKQVNQEINRIRLEKEKGAILLQRTIDYLDTGIMAVNGTGHIEVLNDAAKNIFGKTRIEHVGELRQIEEGLPEKFAKLSHDTGNVIHFLGGHNEQVSLLVSVSSILLETSKLRLYALQDIKNQLEASEIESWQKMTRVLAHEISNSVTPISTLGSSIYRKLKQGKKDKEGQVKLSGELTRDLLRSSELIEKRGNALVDFIEHYKRFARLPDPVLEMVELGSFMKNLKLFFADDTEKMDIQFEWTVSDDRLCILADVKLLEQAFINLIRNSCDALSDHKEGKIQVNARRNDKHQVSLEVIDNGPGIPEEIRSQVFIPFFSTKPGGNGIGLSIVRKIIISSGGNIDFNSNPEYGTKFVVTMPECRLND